MSEGAVEGPLLPIGGIRLEAEVAMLPRELSIIAIDQERQGEPGLCALLVYSKMLSRERLGGFSPAPGLQSERSSQRLCAVELSSCRVCGGSVKQEQRIRRSRSSVKRKSAIEFIIIWKSKPEEGYPTLIFGQDQAIPYKYWEKITEGLQVGKLSTGWTSLENPHR